MARKSKKQRQNSYLKVGLHTLTWISMHFEIMTLENFSVEEPLANHWPLFMWLSTLISLSSYDLAPHQWWMIMQIQQREIEPVNSNPGKILGLVCDRQVKQIAQGMHRPQWCSSRSEICFQLWKAITRSDSGFTSWTVMSSS